MWVHVVVWFRSIPAFWIARTSDDGQVICKSAALPYQFIFISPTYLSNSRGTDAPGLWLNVCSKSPTDPLLIALLSPYCTQLRKEHKSAFFGGGCALITLSKIYWCTGMPGVSTERIRLSVSLQAPFIFFISHLTFAKKTVPLVTFRIAPLTSSSQSSEVLLLRECCCMSVVRRYFY
jgi:hypothetical protein